MGWLGELLARLQDQGPVLLAADPRWGVSHLIAALNEPKRPLIWCELSPIEADDPVSQGNKLAKAVRRALAGANGRSPLPDTRVLELWRTVDGAYEPFLVRLNETLGLPVPLRPGPEGLGPIPGYEPRVEPAQLLEALLRRERYLEALELAVQHSPEAVPRVLEEAGDYFTERGLEGRLYALLDKLPTASRLIPAVLTQCLTAAIVLGEEQAVLPEVAAALAGDELPDLRALYARALFNSYSDSEACLRKAERVVRAARTPQTLFAYGSALLLQDPANTLFNIIQPPLGFCLIMLRPR